MAKIIDKGNSYVIVKYTITEYKKIQNKSIEDFDIDFKELQETEITPNIKKAINETKNIPKKLLCNV